jgi:hypothetical protein
MAEQFKAYTFYSLKEKSKSWGFTPHPTKRGKAPVPLLEIPRRP